MFSLGICGRKVDFSAGACGSFMFPEIAQLISRLTLPFCDPSLSDFGVVNVLYFSHSERYGVIPHVVLICISLMNNDVEHGFMYLLMSVYPLW